MSKNAARRLMALLATLVVVVASTAAPLTAAHANGTVLVTVDSVFFNEVDNPSRDQRPYPDGYWLDDAGTEYGNSADPDGPLPGLRYAIRTAEGAYVAPMGYDSQTRTFSGYQLQDEPAYIDGLGLFAVPLPSGTYLIEEVDTEEGVMDVYNPFHLLTSREFTVASEPLTIEMWHYYAKMHDFYIELYPVDEEAWGSDDSLLVSTNQTWPDGEKHVLSYEDIGIDENGVQTYRFDPAGTVMQFAVHDKVRLVGVPSGTVFYEHVYPDSIPDGSGVNGNIVGQDELENSESHSDGPSLRGRTDRYCNIEVNNVTFAQRFRKASPDGSALSGAEFSVEWDYASAGIHLYYQLESMGDQTIHGESYPNVWRVAGFSTEPSGNVLTCDANGEFTLWAPTYSQRLALMCGGSSPYTLGYQLREVTAPAGYIAPDPDYPLITFWSAARYERRSISEPPYGFSTSSTFELPHPMFDATDANDVIKVMAGSRIVVDKDGALAYETAEPEYDWQYYVTYTGQRYLVNEPYPTVTKRLADENGEGRTFELAIFDLGETTGTGGDAPDSPIATIPIESGDELPLDMLEDGHLYFIAEADGDDFTLARIYLELDDGSISEAPLMPGPEGHTGTMFAYTSGMALPGPIIFENDVLKTVAGTKTWDDGDDADGLRPDSITVHLLADGEEVASVTVGEKDGWAWKFDALPKVDEGGKAIEYTVREDVPDGYTASYNGYDITNTHVVGPTDEPETPTEPTTPTSPATPAMRKTPSAPGATPSTGDPAAVAPMLALAALAALALSLVRRRCGE